MHPFASHGQGFLRIVEFTYDEKDLLDPDFANWHITRSSIVFYYNYLELTLSTSKNDPFLKGATCRISATFDTACAVIALRNLFAEYSAPPHTPVFDVGQKAFTAAGVRPDLEERLQWLGYKGHYSGHSFRRGAATEARNRGVPAWKIQLLGR